MDKFSKYSNRWMQLFYSLLIFLFGLVAIIHPDATLDILAIFFSYILLAGGFLQIIFSFTVKIRGLNKPWVFGLNGIIDMVIGILIISFPSKSIELFVYIVAVWLILFGIGQIVVMISQPHKFPRKYLILLCGVLLVILGVSLILNPYKGETTLAYMIGVLALITGVVMFIRTLGLIQLEKR